jgi:hypothetical protein
MKMDLRLPTIVITGAWNANIFTPPWIGKHLFRIAEGTEVSANQIIIQTDLGLTKSVLYIEKVGLSLAEGRLELFVEEFQDPTILKLIEVIQNVVNVLNHTPMDAIGINFSFFEETPTAEISDKLKNPDKLDQIYTIKSNKISTNFQFDSEFDLNLARSISGGVAKIEFNFHRNISKEYIVSMNSNSIFKLNDAAKKILEDEYNVDNIEYLSHQIATSKNREENY